MMIETVVYTYKTPQYYIHSNLPSEQIKWLQDSILSARNCGYLTCLFTDDKDVYEMNISDENYLVKDNSYIWDSLKIYVLENYKNNNFFLSDNDVIFKKPINFLSNVDLYFDIVERRFSWETIYEPTLNDISRLNVLEEVPYWNNYLGFTYNLGILKINNINLKNSYIEQWKYVHSLLSSYVNNPFNPYYLTPILSQYLLTLLSSNYTVLPLGKLNKNPELENPFYTHYRGGLKRKFRKDLI